MSSLFSLKNHKQDIDKTYLYAKDFMKQLTNEKVQE